MNLADVEFVTRDDVLVANVTGEVDLSNADRLGRVIAEATSNHLAALVLNLSETDYFDSAGIRLIFELRDGLHRRGLDFRLVIQDSSPAHDALRLAGLSGRVEIVHTVDAALSSLA
jgi:anti-anti-sigma factor